MTHASTHPWGDRLAGAIERTGSAACVGLDPVLERLPPEVRAAHPVDPVPAIEAFSLAVVRAVAGVAPVVKLQSACYERYGSRGVAALAHVAHAAREAGLLVLLDAKRGDIGISAAHYAAAATELGADAITVNAYLGTETIEPYLQAGLGVYALVRTSNPGSGELQGQALASGGSVAECVAKHLSAFGRRWIGSRGLSSVGAVVGATKAGEMAASRAAMPDAPILVPGVGAQGGTVTDCAPLRRAGAGGLADAGVLLTASRSVIYAHDHAEAGAEWTEAVHTAAAELSSETASVFA